SSRSRPGQPRTAGKTRSSLSGTARCPCGASSSTPSRSPATAAVPCSPTSSSSAEVKILATTATAVLLLLASAAAAPVAAQRVERTGAGAPSVDERLDEVLAGRHLLVTRD